MLLSTQNIDMGQELGRVFEYFFGMGYSRSVFQWPVNILLLMAFHPIPKILQYDAFETLWGFVLTFVIVCATGFLEGREKSTDGFNVELVEKRQRRNIFCNESKRFCVIHNLEKVGYWWSLRTYLGFCGEKLYTLVRCRWCWTASKLDLNPHMFVK